MALSNGGTTVTAIGLQSTQRVLRELDPVLVRAMDAEIRGSVNLVRDTARSLAPRATGGLRRGITSRKGPVRRRGKAVAWQVRSNTVQGAILELAESGHTPQGRSLVTSLTARYGAPGRFVWEAWDREKDAVTAGLTRALDAAQDVIQSRLDSAR